MEEVILTAVKKYIGIPNNDGFDEELLRLLNSIFATFDTVLGVDPLLTAEIDNTTVWPDYGSLVLNSMIREFVCLETRLLFDPPSNVSVKEFLLKQKDRLGGIIEMQ